MTGPELATIAGAATILAVTPGPETILTVRLSALRRKAGLIYSFGSATGMTIWMVAAITGISTLLRAYPAALTVLKIGGGAYLCFLGILAARQALRLRAQLRAGAADVAEAPTSTVVDPNPPTGPITAIAEATDDLVVDAALDPQFVSSTTEPAPIAGKTSWGELRSVISYRRGLISSLTNPKSGLFFLAVMPTLVPASAKGPDYVLLVAITVSVLLAYQLVLACVANFASATLSRRSTDFWIEAVSASVLVLMGITVALVPF